MNLADVMDELALRLSTIGNLRVSEWPTASTTPPAAFVDYPEEYAFDATYGRGCDTMNIPVVVVVGQPSVRAARGLLSGYLAGAGTQSVKAALERGRSSAFDSIQVSGAEIEIYELAATKYLAAIFSCEITGQGG